MLLFCALDSAQGNRTVKGHEAALVLDGQGQQIQVCELAMAMNFAVIERLCVQRAQVIWPEMVQWGLAKGLQGLYGLQKRGRLGIARLADDANTTVLRERATCPARRCVRASPSLGCAVEFMGGVNQCDQDIHIKQGMHALNTFFFAYSVNQLVGHTRHTLTIG